MLSRAENGQWNGGRVPYGYDWSKEEKRFSVNSAEAKVVTLIYERTYTYIHLQIQDITKAPCSYE